MATTIPSQSPCLLPTYPVKYLDRVLPNCNLSTCKAASKFRCLKNDGSSESHEAFSVLKTDIPCDVGSVWSSTGFYVFSIHVPLSFGGLSVASKILHQPVLDSQIQDVNNPFLKQILSSGSSSVIVCTLIYCIVTPFLEEIVYRGFLLTSLSSKMKWQQAVVISSIVFSAAHFSVENFLQLFIVGLVLGSSYCWTGNLSSSLAIHSMYNALTLFATFMS